MKETYWRAYTSSIGADWKKQWLDVAMYGNENAVLFGDSSELTDVAAMKT